MKQRKGLERRTPLRPGKPLGRGKGLERGSKQLARVPISAKPSTEDPRLTASRPIVAARSGGQCECVFEDGRRCSNVATDVHHIIRRRDSDHSPVQLIHLCWWCHLPIAHWDKPRAERLGLWQHFWMTPNERTD